MCHGRNRSVVLVVSDAQATLHFRRESVAEEETLQQRWARSREHEEKVSESGEGLLLVEPSWRRPFVFLCWPSS